MTVCPNRKLEKIIPRTRSFHKKYLDHEAAREYFHLPDDVNVTTYDGRAFLNAIDKKYDVIMVDAYQDITIPFQMSSKEFFTIVKDHLNENGVMVVNMNMRGHREVTL